MVDNETKQPENGSAEPNGGPDAQDVRRRERSKIGFPYGDLADAVEVAKTIFKHGGQRASLDQLAAWMKHESVDSGTFRVSILTARMFGLVEAVKDHLTLTELGNQIRRSCIGISGACPRLLKGASLSEGLRDLQGEAASEGPGA